MCVCAWRVGCVHLGGWGGGGVGVGGAACQHLELLGSAGGCDGQLRLWDIRRSGPLRIFDQHQTQEAHRAARQAQQAQQGQEGQQARSSGGNGNRGAYGKRRRSDHDAGPSQRGSVLNGHGAGSGGGSNSSARRVQRNGGNPTTSSSGAGPGAGPPGHRMFLPDKVTRYATAHGASITAVHPTPDGLFWLSAGTDDRVRLWDAMTYRWVGGLRGGSSGGGRLEEVRRGAGGVAGVLDAGTRWSIVTLTFVLE